MATPLGKTYKVVALPEDIKEIGHIERMKRDEDARKKRIFNTKSRMIGIDKIGLERQINEKKRTEEIKRAEDQKYYEAIVNAAKNCEKVEKEISEAKWRLQNDIEAFRKTYQRRQDKLDVQIPPCCEKELGISSGQFFEGEDEKKERRKALQMEQQRNWLIQQIKEKSQKTKEKFMAEEKFSVNLNQKHERALYLERLERSCRREIEAANKAINEALARESKARKNMIKDREEKDSMMEILNSINSDLLTENPDSAQSICGPGKILQYHYKGMSPEETEEIRKFQLQQIDFKKNKHEENKVYDRKWANFFLNAQADFQSKSRQLNDQIRDFTKEIMEENKKLDSENKFNRRSELNDMKSAYSTSEFFSKFNTSSR